MDAETKVKVRKSIFFYPFLEFFSRFFLFLSACFADTRHILIFLKLWTKRMSVKFFYLFFHFIKCFHTNLFMYMLHAIIVQKEGSGRTEVRESTPMTDYLVFGTKRRIRMDRSERVHSHDKISGCGTKRRIQTDRSESPLL